MLSSLIQRTEQITTRVLREIDFDVDAFADAANDFIPADFYTREQVAKSMFRSGAQERRSSTIEAVREMQAIHRAARMGQDKSAIGALLVKLIDDAIDNIVAREIDDEADDDTREPWRDEA